MKFKILFNLFMIVLVCTVFTAACLDSNQNMNDPVSPINPLNKKIEPFKSSFPENVPFDDEIILYKPWANTSWPGYTIESLPSDADTILYGTLKTINPSVWSTADRNPPPAIFNTPARKGGFFGFENGTTIEVNGVSIPGCDDSIYTTVIFEVNDMAKGENTEEVTVVIPSGQVGNHISLDSYYPTIWDLEVGQQYLVYLKNYEGRYPGMGDDTILMIMPPGLFVIVE